MAKRPIIIAFSLVFEIGFLLATPVIVLIFGGLWLDKKFHTIPLFTITGAIMGLTGGMINTYRAVKKLSDNI